MKIEIKNVKHAKFASEETDCFEATIVIDGKPAGKVSNDGRGGCNFYHFTDRDLEKRFHAYCKFLPPLPPSPGMESHGPLAMDADLLVGKLLEEFLQRKEYGRACKTKTLYRLRDDEPDTYWTLKMPFSVVAKDLLHRRYGSNLLEIINETLGGDRSKSTRRRSEMGNEAEKDKRFDAPDLSQTSDADLVAMMLACGPSRDESDRDFARACRDELARRKPTTNRENE